LIELVEKALTTLRAAFPEISDESLEEEYPLEVGGCRLTTGLFLLHLAAHLAYHLGQIDYHRRVVTGGESLVGMQSMPALVRTSGDS
jgi:hypothetical protein